MVRRGPKPKAGKRETNGKPSRRVEELAERALMDAKVQDQGERETLAGNMAARHRVHGIKLEQARDQRAGSFVGRLCIREEISATQYHAAEMYAVEAAAYLRAMVSPREPGAIDLNATRGQTNRISTRADRSAFHRYESSLKAITEKQNEMRGTVNLYGALNLCVVQDAELPHLVADLCIALDALVKHYRLTTPRKAA